MTVEKSAQPWRPPWRLRHAGRVELLAIHDALLAAFGPQGWWPGKTPFEVMVGAILTQNTNWRNVERAIANLRAARALTPAAMLRLAPEALAELIRPAGYFRVKATRLGHLLGHLEGRHGGSVARLLRVPLPSLREELLGISGIGPETADSILLYAAGLPSFVVDAYTKRVFSRHGLVPAHAGYAEVQALFTRALVADAPLFNEYHALIVRLGKEFCRPREPRCAACPLGQIRAFARIQQSSRHLDRGQQPGCTHESPGGRAQETLEASNSSDEQQPLKNRAKSHVRLH